MSLFLNFFLWLLVAFGLLTLFRLRKRRPSNNHNWNLGQEIPATAEFKNDKKVLVKNIRHISYKTADDYIVSRYNREYDLSKIKKVWIALVHFTGHKGAAHSFVSFEFENDQFLSVSVEVRKKGGEQYSAAKGLFRHFELIYVIADERDVIRLRTDHHKDNVFFYPMTLSKEDSQKLFLDMIERANHLAENPEFYNTISNACFGNIVKHINRIIPGKLPFDYRIVIPENSDAYVHKQGLLDTDLPFPEFRTKHKINDLAKKYGDDPDFSLRIRGR